MAGTNCNSCCFASWQDQSQVGCLLDRLDKYKNIDCLNEEKNGFYKVLVENICPAKRTKDWLKDHPKRPELAVREELYPKVQLIVIIEELNDGWLRFFKNDFSKFSAIDVLVFSGTNVLEKLGFLINQKNFFLHTCYKTDSESTFVDEVKHQINYIVRKDCQFYLTCDYDEYSSIGKWTDRLDYYLNDTLKPVFLVYDDYKVPDESFLDSMLVYTPLHMNFGGFGSQNIIDKIIIHCANHNQAYGVYTCEHFFQECPAEQVKDYNTVKDIG